MFDFDSCVTIYLPIEKRLPIFEKLSNDISSRWDKLKQSDCTICYLFFPFEKWQQQKNVHIISHLFICLLHFSPYFCIHQLQKWYLNLKPKKNKLKYTNKNTHTHPNTEYTDTDKNRYICIWYTRNAKTKKNQILPNHIKYQYHQQQQQT